MKNLVNTPANSNSVVNEKILNTEFALKYIRRDELVEEVISLYTTVNRIKLIDLSSDTQAVVANPSSFGKKLLVNAYQEMAFFVPKKDVTVPESNAKPGGILEILAEETGGVLLHSEKKVLGTTAQNKYNDTRKVEKGYVQGKSKAVKESSNNTPKEVSEVTANIAEVRLYKYTLERTQKTDALTALDPTSPNYKEVTRELKHRLASLERKITRAKKALA